MFLAAQYYRPPFPNRKYWADDFARMRDSGLHAVQLWAIWGWIESQPGVYSYDDYDELVALAEKVGLKVVISTIAEIHPFWIHRLVPGCEMVDHTGRTVISVPRVEVNNGLTPGGCFDDRRVAELMRKFLTDIAGRYGRCGHLAGWDCWNETRWNVHAGGRVCYCPSTLREFRAWLDRRHGGRDGLSAAWQRRYVHWDDVQPSRATGRTYTDMMEFTRFLAERAAQHMRFRCEALRAGDPKHLISAHCALPAVQFTGWGGDEQALCRGNDWDHADVLDGFGCSHFPFWGAGFDDVGFGLRVEEVRSANRGKVTWVSELQGGSARSGIIADRSVPAGPQQRWVANGMARGAKAVIFWCWRDEVFGPESSGFGLSGWDGLAAERLAAMKATGRFIDAHNDLIEPYVPDPAKVGVLFTPDNYHLRYAQDGNAGDAAEGILACATALERLSMPYDFVEAYHLDALARLSVLLMPWSLVLPPAAAEAVLAFLRRGGRIFTEAECDAFDGLGFYRYPDERPFMKALGIHDLGRRKLEAGSTLTATLGGRSVALAPDNFTTPLEAEAPAEVLAANEQNQPLFVRREVGKGAAYVLGTFLGKSYQKNRNEGLERLIEHICADANVRPDFEVTADDAQPGLLWRCGRSGAKSMLWIVNAGDARKATVTDRAARLGSASQAEELVTGRAVAVAGGQLQVDLPASGFAVLCW